MSNLKPFSQIPVYNKDALISIPINDFIELQEFLKVFYHPFSIVQKAYFKAINDKVITFSYREEDGTEISEEEARNRINEFNSSNKKDTN